MTRALLAGCISLSLASCATLTEVGPPPAGSAQRERALLSLDDWRFRGRLAVRYGQSGEQANVDWLQQDQRSQIRISGPLGAGAYEIVLEPGLVRVSGSDVDESLTYTGPDAANRFVEEQIGWSFPARSARYWMLGVADPDYGSRKRFDAAGGLAGLEQDGWQVDYERFVESSGHILPGKLRISNDDAELRVVIQTWVLPTPDTASR